MPCCLLLVSMNAARENPVPLFFRASFLLSHSMSDSSSDARAPQTFNSSAQIPSFCDHHDHGIHTDLNAELNKTVNSPSTAPARAEGKNVCRSNVFKNLVKSFSPFYFQRHEQTNINTDREDSDTENHFESVEGIPEKSSTDTLDMWAFYYC